MNNVKDSAKEMAKKIFRLFEEDKITLEEYNELLDLLLKIKYE